MIRKAWIMEVLPDKHEEYKKRHNPIWPELQEVFASHGVHNYSIFLQEETNQLFAYVELESEEQWQAIGKTEVAARWREYMTTVMPTNPDKSAKRMDLREVFHID